MKQNNNKEIIIELLKQIDEVEAKIMEIFDEYAITIEYSELVELEGERIELVIHNAPYYLIKEKSVSSDITLPILTELNLEELIRTSTGRHYSPDYYGADPILLIYDLDGFTKDELDDLGEQLIKLHDEIVQLNCKETYTKDFMYQYNLYKRRSNSNKKDIIDLINSLDD